MKNIKLYVSVFAIIFFMSITKLSHSQTYPKNYVGIYLTSGEFDLYNYDLDNNDPNYNIYDLYYFRTGLSYARRLSKSLYLGARTHKISEDHRYKEIFLKVNFLTRYRFQPIVGISLSGVKNYGSMINLNFGWDLHIGKRMTINSHFVGAINEYAYNINLGLNYKF